MYVRDPAEIVLVASNVGSQRDPAWLHNVKANPDVWFLTVEHGWRRYEARIENGDARAALWARAQDLYIGYQTYQQRAQGREIPVVVLEPADHDDTPRTPAL